MVKTKWTSMKSTGIERDLGAIWRKMLDRRKEGKSREVLREVQRRAQRNPPEEFPVVAQWKQI